MRRPFLPLAIAVGLTAAYGVAYVLAGLAGWGPPAANEQAIGEVSRWCERVSDGIFREPANALGNLGFVAVGLAIFWTLGRDERRGRRGGFHGNTPIALLYAAAATFLGPGSMLMHGSHLRAGAWLDNVSMVAYILVPWLLNVSLLGGWRDRTMFAAYAAFLALYAAGYWFIGPDLGIGLDFFQLSIGLWMVSEALVRWWAPGPRAWLGRLASGLVGIGLAAAFGIFPGKVLARPDHYWWIALFWLPGLVARQAAPERRRYTPWFWLGFASFFSAYMVWLQGTPASSLCVPDSPIQAHAIWHLLSAAATGCFFLFLRTARPRRDAHA